MNSTFEIHTTSVQLCDSNSVHWNAYAFQNYFSFQYSWEYYILHMIHVTTYLLRFHVKSSVTRIAFRMMLGSVDNTVVVFLRSPGQYSNIPFAMSKLNRPKK